MEDYIHWYDLGNRCYRAGDWAGALTCLLKATRINRQAVQAWCDLAATWTQLGRREEAKQAWSESLRWQPTMARAHRELGQLCAQARQWDEAAVHFRRAMERDTSDSEPHIGLGIALLRLGQTEEALGVLGEVLAREPGRLAAWRAYDEALRERGDQPQAQSLYRQHAASLPSHPAVWLAQLRYANEATNAPRVGDLLAAAAAHPWTEDDADLLRQLLVEAAGRIDADADMLAQLHRRYGEIVAAGAAKAGPLYWPRRTTSGDDARLRVAYVVAGDRATGVEIAQATPGERLVAHLVRSHDAGNVALTVYWLASDAPADATRASLAAAGAALRALAGVPQARVARLIAEDDPDVLVDCSGLSAPVMATILAMQSARVRIALPAYVASYPAPLISHVLTSESGQASARVLGAQTALVDADFPSLDADDAQWAAFSAKLEDAYRRLVAGAARAEIDAAALRVIWNQAVSAHQTGDATAAESRYRRLLGLQPEFAPARFMFATLLRAQGRNESAVPEYLAAVGSAPDFAEARLALADLYLESSRPADAARSAEDGLKRACTAQVRAKLERVRGLACLRHDQVQEAISAYRAALAIDPSDAQTYFNLGVALHRANDSQAAIASYQTAAILAPETIDSYFNLGALYQQQRDYSAAISCFRQAVQLRPDFVAAYKSLGECLFAARRYDAWLANFHEFAQRCPRALPLAVYALQACQYAGDLATLDRYLEALRKEQFGAASETELVDCLEELLYLLLFFDVDPADMLSFYNTYDKSAPHLYGAPLAPSPDRRKGARIRIGYLSGDFRDHVMGKMMLPVIETHDRERFEVFCYSMDAREDDVTRRFRGAAEHYDVLAQCSENEAALRIAADQLDLLIDLSTHTQGARPGILARKPARVQITHVASAGAVGLSSIDFKLTDRYADLPANQEMLIERLLPMQTCCYPFRRIACASAHGYQRERFGLRSEHVVIGAFVTLMKLSRRCLNLWRDVLARIPNAVLALSPVDPKLEPYYIRVFQQGGIRPDRLLFLPQAATEAENLARYALVDFVLDPMPFGGVNGTMEALSMSVPVVTLCGRKHSERTSYSIMKHLGIEGTLAASGSEYVDIAVRLAEDAGFRAEMRKTTRERLAVAPSADIGHYTRCLESAYEQALQLSAQAAGAEQV